MLVIFSDMRHHTRDLDLESPRVVPDFDHINLGKGLTARLTGVQVYVLGTDGAGETIAYWQSLRGFWAGYFQDSGAILESYSVLRDLPASDQQTKTAGATR